MYFITECANLSAPMFGSVSQIEIRGKAAAVYSCKTGYQLSGSEERFCLPTGNWTGTEAVCEPTGESSM